MTHVDDTVPEGATSEAPALFVAHGDGWLPTAYSRGPWSPTALHGGPVAALVTRALERVAAPAPARLTRLTIELLRPVPIAPLEITTQVIRPGAKVATLEASVRLADGGTVVALARAQRVRTAALELHDGADDQPPELPEDRAVLASWPGSSAIAFHSSATEHRFVRGMFGAPGPAFDWVRLLVPVVPDEEPTGWQRAAAVADFANGISAVVPFGSALFINPDLTVHLWREPIGEWIGADAVTRTSSTGIGTSESALWDRSGRIGRGMQSLLLEE